MEHGLFKLLKKIGYFSKIIFFFYFLFSFINQTIAYSWGQEMVSSYVDNPMIGLLLTLVMFLTITLVASEKIQRTLVVFLIASVLIFFTYTFWNLVPEFKILTLEDAFRSIDWEVIWLLLSMMIIVWVLAQTNVFEWLAFKLFEISRWNIFKLFFLFIITTWVLSAFLDNVTTIILITPIAIKIANIFKINPISFVIPMIIASNLWGAATLIWDPPNIMIWSFAGLSFNDFLRNMGLPVLFISLILCINMYLVFNKNLKNALEIKDVDSLISKMRNEYKIKHKKLLFFSGLSLVFVIIFFLLHSSLHMPATVPALMWAAFLMFCRDRLMRRKFWKNKEVMEEAIHNSFSKDVEWLVLAFFVFLFMIVWALENTWILDLVANLIKLNFWENLLLCALVILWVSAIFSALLDNIPFTAVMLPVVANLIAHYWWAWFDASFLWWALALWACFWWNWTLIWASANLVAAWVLAKNKIYLSFMQYLKVGLPSMIIQVFFASFFVYLMYLNSL